LPAWPAALLIAVGSPALFEGQAGVLGGTSATKSSPAGF